jgi:putative RecB family exonuclease
VAERLTGRDYISYSAVSTYQQCPLRYFFRYIAGLPEETVSSSLVFGGAIHAAVEHHFRELMIGNAPPHVDDLIQMYTAAWEERGSGAVQFGKDENRSSLDRLAGRMLKKFRDSDLARPEGTIIGVEEELREPLIPGVPDLLARVDLLVDAGDALVVTDLKTARSRWSENQADESSEQLLLYGQLARRLVPDKNVRLQFAVVTKAKTKEPSLDRYRIENSPHRARRTLRIVERVWRAIESGVFYPAPSPMHCPTCPFREPCRRWNG